MTEKPILFSAPMVRALLLGSKTVTRRVVKGFALEWLTMHNGFNAEFVALPENHLCPYGQPGDRLWVRETFEDCSSALHSCVIYRADGVECGVKWSPSIHMPRWASRITLEITGVRVERLQDISETDALAEGVMTWADGACAKGNPKGLTPVDYYELLWSRINGRESWDANPFVWCVEFKRLEA